MDYSSWSETYKTKKISESTFNAKYDEIDLLQLENLIAIHKLNNDLVHLNESELRTSFWRQMEPLGFAIWNSVLARFQFERRYLANSL